MNLSRFEYLTRSTNPACRALTAVLARCYGWGVAWDHRRHQQRLQQPGYPKQLPVPVISIGNLTAGGTGKTPLVSALLRQCQQLGGQPAILSRGYQSDGEVNDEYRLLARWHPEVPHRQNPDRYAGGLELLKEHPETDLILLDDGFQHRKLHRDLNLLVLDATRPFGYGELLPRGLLREPWSGISRADALVVTRMESCCVHKQAIFKTALQQFYRSKPVFFAKCDYRGLVKVVGEWRAISTERGAKDFNKVVAFAGIANPQPFFRALESLGFQVMASHRFPDHHHFASQDIQQMRDLARQHQAQALICTEKDGVKLESLLGAEDAQPTAAPIFQLQQQWQLDMEPLLRPLLGK